MKRILTIVGARPQFIKSSVVSKKLREAGLDEILVHTGQHYDYNMSDVFFRELEMREPDYNLGAGSGSHGEMTGRMLSEIEKILLKEMPDAVLVYGDTNSTLAGALAASKLKIPVAHVEAGLRSYNKGMPEEINRVLTDHVSAYLFAPTETGVKNLAKEGITDNVFNVGDVMFDVAIQVKKKIGNRSGEILAKYNLESKNYILATIHRADNTDVKENLLNIWESLVYIAHEGGRIFFPVHPRTLKCIKDYGLLDRDLPGNFILAEPVSYMEMILLEDNAKVIVTDSGGVQKESYFFRTPAVIPRNETEWVEIVEAGWNVLAGNGKAKIIDSINRYYNSDIDKEWIPFYGEGNAAGKIVDILS